ncbi:MAG TPA: HD domain-containing protein [Candidatus Eisenbergiella merdigallinarum]|uniref:HD domain-containing protein n=1 Tax=Candidatus Eisenbergiella merdigallinarum TaxID=2838552 RepID=A0A9D2SCP3_9FIRM|nr:HD domain-containing protein [Candidatus Eisenbergiella merdigallinarum]
MYPEREEAERLLEEAWGCNPGPWADHSRVTAACAERIAGACGMDPAKAYALGLLHDIGRKFGIKHLGHVYDGYRYMKELGYDEAAKICLTHSFSVPDLETYVGRFDISPKQQEELKDVLAETEYDEYDRLIQLCDCLAGPDGVVDMEARMEDVRERYGSYPEEKRRKNLELRGEFEARAGRDIYELVGKPCARKG